MLRQSLLAVNGCHGHYRDYGRMLRTSTDRSSYSLRRENQRDLGGSSTGSDCHVDAHGNGGTRRYADT